MNKICQDDISKSLSHKFFIPHIFQFAFDTFFLIICIKKLFLIFFGITNLNIILMILVSEKDLKTHQEEEGQTSKKSDDELQALADKVTKCGSVGFKQGALNSWLAVKTNWSP